MRLNDPADVAMNAPEITWPDGGVLAPIVLFVHSRADHTRRTLEALKANTVASQSDLFVFCDAARNEREAQAVHDVRSVVDALTGFRSITVVSRQENFGLARSIIDGVTAVVERYGRVIVLEDDLVTAPHFLAFMNEALDRYAGVRQVWHVNGWTYPIESGLGDAPYFTPVMECWGWATWADRWCHFRKDPGDLLGRWTPAMVHRFNIEGGYDYWGDIRRNAHGTMRTWAVFWYATLFERDGLCLSPNRSFVENIGIDGSGANSGSRDIYAAVRKSGTMPERWPAEPVADRRAFEAVRDFLLSQRPPLWRRVARRVKWAGKRIGRMRAG